MVKKLQVFMSGANLGTHTLVATATVGVKRNKLLVCSKSACAASGGRPMVWHHSTLMSLLCKLARKVVKSFWGLDTHIDY